MGESSIQRLSLGLAKLQPGTRRRMLFVMVTYLSNDRFASGETLFVA